MREWIGLGLIIIGCCFGIASYLEWFEGKNNVQYLTEKELNQYNQAKAEDSIPSPQKSVSLPASQVNYKLGAEIAALVIPRIGQKYSIYWGADEKTLKRGVGMYVSDLTTPPDGNGHTVLSGHRDTVFTQLGELKEKDKLLVEYNGAIFTYEVRKIWITDENDRTVIVKKDRSILTLTTCYPFNYIGSAPDRYIIQAELISTS